MTRQELIEKWLAGDIMLGYTITKTARKAAELEQLLAQQDTLDASTMPKEQHLQREVTKLRGIVRRYGDRLKMSFAPPELQQTIDDAFTEADHAAR